MEDIWIFGYGSLIFKVDFPYKQKQPATLAGWSRRFWQASTDHRGTPAFAGRVATLIETPGSLCWGVAYEIAATDVSEVLEHLDYREKNGYRRLDESVLLDTGSAVSAITYLADEHNASYLGDAALSDMAKQIVKAVGPSGKNIDYLLQLEASLIDNGQIDEHVFSLSSAARELLL